MVGKAAQLDAITAADLIVGLAEIEEKFTAAVSLMRGLSLNDVLGTETAAFDANGIISRDYAVPFAYVAVGNLGSGTVVVANTTLQVAAPTIGPGVAIVPAGQVVGIAVAGNSLTFYGTAGQRISFTVLTKPYAPVLAGADLSAGGASSGTPTATADQTTAGAGALTVLAANPVRKSALIQNVSAAGVNARVAPVGQAAANRGIQLTPGGVFRVETPYVPTGAFDVVREGGTNVTVSVLEVV